MSGGPSSRPTNASCAPSGEKRGRLASPTPAVSRWAGPPFALTRHRSSSHVKTRSSPWSAGKRKYPGAEPTMPEILTNKWFASGGLAAGLRRRGHPLRQQEAQYVRQDAAVAVVVDLDRRIDAAEHVKCEFAAVRPPPVDRERLARAEP